MILLVLVSFSSASSVEISSLKDGKKWAYSVTFDDSKKSLYNVLPIFEKYNYTASVGVITKRADYNNYYYMNWTDVLKFYNEDWDIASHSVNHLLVSELSNKEIDYELNYSKQEIESRIPDFEVSGHVYPFGDISNEYVLSAVKKYYDFAEVNYLDTDVNNVDSLNDFLINRRPIYENAFLYNWRFDRASNLSKDNAVWLVEYTHGVDDINKIGPYDTDTDTLERHFDYLYENYGVGGKDEVWVAPTRKVHNYIVTRENTIVQNEQISDNEISFYLDMSKVPNYVEDKNLTLKVFVNWSDVEIFSEGKPISYSDKGDYLEFSTGEGKVEIKNNESGGIVVDPIISNYTFTVSSDYIQFNGWTNISWNSDDEFEIKVVNPMGKLVYNSNSSEGSVSLKGYNLYYAGVYKVYCNNVSCGNFTIEKWTNREKNLPNISIERFPDQVFENKSAVISWNSVDDSQLIAGYVYVVNPKGKIASQSYLINGEIRLNNLLLGKYTVNARVKDSANNWGYANISFEVIGTDKKVQAMS